MWPAASRNRTIAPNLVDSLARLQQCDEVSWRGSMHKLQLMERREELREVILRAI